MSNHKQPGTEWADRHRQALTTRHTHEDVLTDRQFELLLEACTALPAPHDFEARFICLIAGRLGLRAGEIAHFQTAWINWNRRTIRIPQHEPCQCGYCRRQAHRKRPTTMIYHLLMPCGLDGIRRLSPRRGSFRLISRFEWSYVSNVSLAGMIRFPARGQQSTGGYRPRPTKPIFQDVSIYTVYVRLPPATTPTKASLPCRSKR